MASTLAAADPRPAFERLVARWWQPALLAAALTLGTAARLIYDRGMPLWFDETFTGVIAGQASGAGLWHWLRTELTGPFFYAPMWLWARVAGVSNEALRLPGLLCTLAAPLFVLRRGHPDATLRLAWAAVLLLWMPAAVLANDARPYALLVLLGTLQVAAFCAAVRTPTRAAALRWALVTAAMGLTHYLALLPGLVEGLVFLALRPPRRAAAVARRRAVRGAGGLDGAAPAVRRAGRRQGHGADDDADALCRRRAAVACRRRHAVRAAARGGDRLEPDRPRPRSPGVAGEPRGLGGDRGDRRVRRAVRAGTGDAGAGAALFHPDHPGAAVRGELVAGERAAARRGGGGGVPAGDDDRQPGAVRRRLAGQRDRPAARLRDRPAQPLAGATSGRAGAVLLVRHHRRSRAGAGRQSGGAGRVFLRRAGRPVAVDVVHLPYDTPAAAAVAARADSGRDDAILWVGNAPGNDRRRHATPLFADPRWECRDFGAGLAVSVGCRRR